MHEPHPAEPLSLRRLRAFLARRAAARPQRLPAPRGPRVLSSTHGRREAGLSEAFPARYELSPAAPVVRRATSGGAGPTPPPAAAASPTDRFFRSLLGNSDRPVHRGDESAPAVPPAALPAAEVTLARRIERESPPQIPPMGLQQFLAGRLGLRLPPVRIHIGPAADRLVALFHADAVSFADRIAVRHHRYEPHTVAGAALLGHELTHVAAAAARTGPPPSAAAVAHEERTALANEHRLLVELAHAPHRGPTPPVPVAQPTVAPIHAGTGNGPPASPVPVTPPAAAPVRAAAVDRPQPIDVPVTSLNRTQVAQLKDEVFRELLDRLRTDFERGS